ncbi:Helix-turn-helix [Rhodobacter sp. 24-YEA-8]|nr:Helix-turn-helix [Rhodobacter sp. 24-YEA-8]
MRQAARQRRLLLGWSQADLAARSGVSLGSLKRFETSGEISLTSLLAIAEAMAVLEGFLSLFPMPEPRNLSEIERQAHVPQRAGRKPGSAR